jgi:hypothetical protein
MQKLVPTFASLRPRTSRDANFGTQPFSQPSNRFSIDVFGENALLRSEHRFYY